MSTADNNAVFLSYASQDAEAARRICETLRGGGVEVWFDADGGLEHGDEWDAKIRKQIKECVLFIPVISANTQARHEGYFRIEWDLAAERARGIASGVPFILPVVIDDTREPDALVPDRFRAVQWTRLRNGDVPPEVKARFLKLWSHRIGALKSEADDVGRGRRTPPSEFSIAPTAESGEPGHHPSRTHRSPAAKISAFVAVAIIGVAVFVWWQRSREAAPAAGPNAMASAKQPASGSEVEQLVTRAYAFFEKRMNYTRADLAAADTLTRKATDLAAESGAAWAARAYVQAAHVWRGWDRSEKRLQDTEAFANRALAFDPTQAKAMLALAELHNAQRAFAQAEAVVRRAIVLQPDDSHLHRVLAAAIAGQARTEEADAMRREIVRRFPRDPLVHYDLGNRQMIAGEFADALQSFDTALALEPFTSGRLNKARVLVAWKGDLAAARGVLEQIPLEDRTEMRAVGVALWLGLLERRLDRVQAAAALTTQGYLDDPGSPNGPKAMSLALALHVAGKEAVAQTQWRAADSAARTRLREQPDDLRANAHLATALAWLGRTDEAAREIATYEATAREQSGDGRPAILLARFYASLGNVGKAVSYLRSAGQSRETTGHLLSLDPWWDKLRGEPEFEAFAAEAKARMAADSTPATAPATSVDPKSVVVLPFANLSGDPAQEYFSDGVTEEIRDALARERDLRVVPRTSAFSFRGRNLSVPEIARALNVAQVVEGTVRRAGGVVRITATLTRVSDAFVDPLPAITSELKDGANLFAIQEAVARAVVEKLTRRTSMATVAVLTKNPAAYDAYLRGREMAAHTSELWANARDEFQGAVELDPLFAVAWANLAIAEAQIFMRTWESATLDRAKKAIEHSLRLQPGLAEAYLARAYVGRALFAPSAEIETDLDQAERGMPNHSEILALRSFMAASRGDRSTGVSLLQRAAQLDPRNGRVQNILGNMLVGAGRYAEAEIAYREASRLLAESVIPLINRGGLYLAWKGDVALARKTLDEAPGAQRNATYWEARARLLMTGPDWSEVEKALAQWPRETEVDRRRLLLFQAELAEAKGDQTKSGEIYAELLPLLEKDPSLGGSRRKASADDALHKLALVYAALGKKEEALSTVRKTLATVPAEYRAEAAQSDGPLAALAQIHARFGEVEKALAIVREQVAGGFWRRNFLLLNPSWPLLRNDPHFVALAKEAPL